MYKMAVGVYEKAHTYRPDDWHLRVLSDNYRSGPFIIAAANRLIAHNRNRIPKELVSAQPFMKDDFQTSIFPTAEHELISVCHNVEHQICDGTPPSEVAVLCRTNFMATAFKDALAKRGVQIQAKAPSTLPPDWKLARSFVTLAANPENDRAGLVFLTARLGEERAEQMRKEATADFQSINSRWLKIRHMQVADVTTAMVELQIGRESVERVRQAIELLPAGATLLELQFAMAQKDAAAQVIGDGVFVGTVHSAKGLEFECVFVTGVEAEQYPGRDDIEEARRLLFVAITRAKRYCAVTRAEKRPNRWKRGEMTISVESPFWREIQ